MFRFVCSTFYFHVSFLHKGKPFHWYHLRVFGLNLFFSHHIFKWPKGLRGKMTETTVILSTGKWVQMNVSLQSFDWNGSLCVFFSLLLFSSNIGKCFLNSFIHSRWISSIEHSHSKAKEQSSPFENSVPLFQFIIYWASIPPGSRCKQTHGNTMQKNNYKSIYMERSCRRNYSVMV